MMQWKLENSFFKDQVADSDNLMERCYDFDYALTRIGKYVKNDYDKLKLKEYILTYYQQLKDIYK